MNGMSLVKKSQKRQVKIIVGKEVKEDKNSSRNNNKEIINLGGYHKQEGEEKE